ncbi:MAG: MMPL family transporter [Schleiferiaceae bacterium]|nr:MMPL family transporter [Schleiferiaceae bacterium]
MEFLYRMRWLIAVLLVGLGIWLAPGLQRALEVDNSLTVWFIEEDPALQSYYQYQENFGNDEVLILAIHQEEGLLRRQPLRQIHRLSDSLQKLAPVAQVYGPAGVRLPSANPLSTATRPFLGAQPRPERIRRLLAEQPFLQQQFFSEDHQTVRLVIKLAKLPDFQQRRSEILAEVKQAARHFFPPEELLYGGVGVIYEALNQLSMRDFALFTGAGYLLMFFLLYGIYRRWRHVAFALLSIALSTFFTLAIYGSLGYRLNLMTTLVPVIIILLCVMDVMHLLNAHEQLPQRLSPRQRALAALRDVGRPCLFTTLTTMAGFLTLTVTPIRVLVIFGVFSALGIALGLFFSFYLGFFFLVSPPTKRVGHQRVARQLQRWQQWVLRHATGGKSLTAALLGLGLTGAFWISIDTNSLNYLPPHHQVRQDHRALEQYLGPYMPLEFLVKPQEASSVWDPALLRSLNQLDTALTAQPGIHRVTGLHSLMQAALAQRYQEVGPRQWQNASLLKMMGEEARLRSPELVASFVAQEGKLGRLVLSGELISAQTLAQRIEGIQAEAAKILGPQARLVVSGYQSLYSRITSYVTQAQVRSLGLAIVIIFLLLWVFLGRLRLAVISLLPNFLPIIAMLGFMGFTGIPLDTATACIASIVLSFSVDDTMHFAYHYQRLRRRGHSPATARHLTVGHVGRAILYTSLLLFAGYFLMVFGELRTVIYFGALSSVAIAFALFGQLVVFPLLLQQFDRK